MWPVIEPDMILLLKYFETFLRLNVKILFGFSLSLFKGDAFLTSKAIIIMTTPNVFLSNSNL